MFSDRRMSVARNLLISTTSTFVVVIALALFTALAFGFVSAIFGATNTYAASTASITTSGTVNIDVSASGNSASIGTDNVEVITDCAAGYTLYIGGSNDNTLYKDGDSSNNNTNSKISPSSGTIESPKPIIGDDGNGHSYLNTWGYSTTAETTVSSSSFIGLTNNINAITTKNSATTGDTIPVYYGVSVGPSTEAGSYSLSSGNTITYYLTMNDSCLPYTIKYNGNYIDSATGKDIETGIAPMSIKHESLGSGDEVTLVASNFRNDGYGFAGWSTTKLDPESSTFATDLQAAVNEHKVFGPNETITLDSNITQAADHDHVITLYAVWIKVAGAMQDWKGCNAMNVGEVTALYDARDDNVYAVAKLADNNCWMIENFRLDSQSTVGNNFKDPTVTNESLAQGYANNFIGLANAEASRSFIDAGNVESNSLYSIDGSKTKTIVGLQNESSYPTQGFRFPRYDNSHTTASVADMTNANQQAYSYGNYYTWAAAVADTNAYQKVDGQSIMGSSICPSGWHLPYGFDGTNGSSGDKSGGFLYLNNALLDGTNIDPTSQEASKIWRTYPNNFIYSGLVNSNISALGEGGYYWSNTSRFRANAYRLEVSASGVSAGTGNAAKSTGRSVRCVAYNTDSNNYFIHFDPNGNYYENMQDLTVERDAIITLPANAYALYGYYFTGWNTAADGSGTSYADGQRVTNLADANETITLYAQWTDCPPNKICYDDNDDNNEINSNTTMANQDIMGATSATLLTSNFWVSDYGFAGWSTKPIEESTKITVSDDVVAYGPNETLTFTAGQYNNYGLKLYAIWVKSAGNMQSWNGCSNLNIGDVTALKDNRDGNTYAVAKLADGNCWMIENLRLNNSATITTSNTNKPRTVNSGVVSIVNDSANSTSSNHLSATGSGSTYWCRGLTSACFDQSRLRTDNTVNVVSSATGADSNIYSYGNYYNWYSATAGRGLYSLANGTDAAGDICPAGWHLPYGGTTATSGSFYYLNNRITDGTDVQDATSALLWRKFPNNYIMSGYTSGASNDIASRGTSGFYWTSTAGGDDENVNASAYHAFITENNIYPGNGNSRKHFGRSVRCVINQ